MITNALNVVAKLTMYIKLARRPTKSCPRVVAVTMMMMETSAHSLPIKH